MPFCSNCGCKVNGEANFCPECGFKLRDRKSEPAVSKAEQPPTPPSQKPETKPEPPIQKAERTAIVLETGKLFRNNYRIEKILERDNEGISYLAIDERCGERRALKMYYQTHFDNISKLMGSLSRINKIRDIANPHVAQVYEVNQSGKPAYIVSEYIEGKSLARIKEQNPAWLTEDKLRELALQLTEAALAVRKAGLSVHSLNLNHIILTGAQKAVILPSGISFEEQEEREDIFYFGIVLSKLISNSAFNETLYSAFRLMERKFDFIPGITLGLNEVLAKCVSRNPVQRYATFGSLSKALGKLPAVAQQDIYTVEEVEIPDFAENEKVPKPQRRFDIYFWILIVFILAFVFVILNTNLLETIFNQEATPFRFTGFLAESADSTDQGTADLDGYRNIRTGRDAPRQRKTIVRPPAPARTGTGVTPNLNIPSARSALQTGSPQAYTPPGAPPAQVRKPNLPTTAGGMVYIYGDTYAYGILKQGADANVSLTGYYISASEVTQAEWKKYMRPMEYSTKGDSYPVDNVTWFDAVQYCNARSAAEGLTSCYTIIGTGSSRKVTCNFKAKGYRLPTEAEWEFAARAKALTRYSGSGSPDPVAWYKGNAKGYMHLVKTKSPNSFGLYDMTGNVSEWCWDWYSTDYIKDMPFINPAGPSAGSYKAIRGGNVGHGEGGNLEILSRSRGLPDNAYRHVGFRVARSK